MSNGLLKYALRALRSEPARPLPQVRMSNRRFGQWFKWLSPGLSVKRWLFVSAAGVLLCGLGIAIWSRQTPVFRLGQFISETLSLVTQLIPNYVSGPLVALVGLLLVLWGHTRSLNTLTDVLMPEGDEELVDRLMTHRRLNRGPRIVAIGGGTGLSTLLRGLKQYSTNITAIVTVADDGGSSGRLRREIGVLPPGDIRNCLAALANEEKLLTELFQYRFQAGNGLSGHSFGNLFLTVMTEVTGDLERAIAAISKVLAVQGQVLPSTLSDIQLWAELEDGRLIKGESNITEANGKIVNIGCTPSHPPALPRVLEAIEKADLIIIGPGSLYTSIIPNLLVPEIVEAIARSKVPSVYVCNIMTQPGETQGYTVSDHIRAIDAATGGRPIFDVVLMQRHVPSASTLIKYSQENSHPVYFDREAVMRQGRRAILANVMEEDAATGYVRHDSDRLARVLLRWYGRIQGL
ncbi:gluconeogenesis factor YvcK family protein [Vacuolonema iberomarrocanum]|uniref:gluconeogenesis factor YvcK family protein n=1 Tax=Vacuolonema iberomarrocanum TaxID=3454632 RepID=UPI0019D8C1B5|nr:YvcK family protein [filamentous cyanobacterium LEGE 07170]